MKIENLVDGRESIVPPIDTIKTSNVNSNNSNSNSQNPRKMSERSKNSRSKEDILCKKCPTCMIIKTPRVFHCDSCNVCVSVHDHHCPWIGGCIGQRNHKYFYVYIVVTWIASTFLLVLNSTFLGKHIQKGMSDQ